MSTKVDPFAGWTMANVGCHWSRQLPDGRMAHLSTWATGKKSGYSLTVDYRATYYYTLQDALAAFDAMAGAQ